MARASRQHEPSTCVTTLRPGNPQRGGRGRGGASRQTRSLVGEGSEASDLSSLSNLSSIGYEHLDVSKHTAPIKVTWPGYSLVQTTERVRVATPHPSLHVLSSTELYVEPHSVHCIIVAGVSMIVFTEQHTELYVPHCHSVYVLSISKLYAVPYAVHCVHRLCFKLHCVLCGLLLLVCVETVQGVP